MLPFGLLPGTDMSDLLGPLEVFVPLRRAAVVVEQHDVEVVRKLQVPFDYHCQTSDDHGSCTSETLKVNFFCFCKLH